MEDLGLERGVEWCGRQRRCHDFHVMRGKGALSRIPRGRRGDQLAFLRTAVA